MLFVALILEKKTSQEFLEDTKADAMMTLPIFQQPQQEVGGGPIFGPIQD